MASTEKGSEVTVDSGVRMKKYSRCISMRVRSLLEPSACRIQHYPRMLEIKNSKVKIFSEEATVMKYKTVWEKRVMVNIMNTVCFGNCQ